MASPLQAPPPPIITIESPILTSAWIPVILPIGFGDFQNLCFPFGPPKLCFLSSYRKNIFYYCATFIRGHRRYQKEGLLCALSIFSGDLLDILIRQAPKSKPHVLSLAVVYANCSVVSQPG